MIRMLPLIMPTQHFLCIKWRRVSTPLPPSCRGVQKFLTVCAGPTKTPGIPKSSPQGPTSPQKQAPRSPLPPQRTIGHCAEQYQTYKFSGKTGRARFFNVAGGAFVVDRGVAMGILRSGAPLYDPVISKEFSQDDAPTESQTLEHLQWTRAT